MVPVPTKLFIEVIGFYLQFSVGCPREGRLAYKSAGNCADRDYDNSNMD